MAKSKKKPIKYYSPKRRKIYSQGDEIDALTLFNLHDWICFICKEQIDPRRRYPDWRAATIEHIIPLALGGEHCWNNVAPAHNRCNQLKGAMTPEQFIEPGQALYGRGSIVAGPTVGD